ncbi:hypothetical protein MPTK1_7g12240 [Marchantia polymorpha subsp. ruderalis]|uniref:Uncharacterized protein n=2 Tax=Marchantia polymorpha TaxID=3197 RepID=A0AAF6BYP7_MARPO|nr:hypothetical protein MARPO_0003s0237 [Marchantia polymorpha]BBN17131.1 hypothetical protein Mp_7g12240 [Marchantia polymorpha subsp. ruderalis]|eukprot:PTQ49370.1 hypothetical protein MARPO_0003s0237 [Marchantia polymorpha]
MFHDIARPNTVKSQGLEGTNHGRVMCRVCVLTRGRHHTNICDLFRWLLCCCRSDSTADPGPDHQHQHQATAMAAPPAPNRWCWSAAAAAAEMPPHTCRRRNPEPDPEPPSPIGLRFAGGHARPQRVRPARSEPSSGIRSGGGPGRAANASSERRIVQVDVRA